MEERLKDVWFVASLRDRPEELRCEFPADIDFNHEGLDFTYIQVQLSAIKEKKESLMQDKVSCLKGHPQEIVLDHHRVGSSAHTCEGRVYKKTNWSVIECLVLQAAKREENDKHDKHRGAKEKWLAIEDYCWEHDVHRSGQQCKDRWYRMALEFKRVYEYQRAIPSGKSSFWHLSGIERKEGRLPIVFHQEIYDAMVDWYLNSKPGNGNLVIDTSVPSPADSKGHNDASNGNCSGTDEGESDDRSGHSLGNKNKKRKTIVKAAESLAIMVERGGEITAKALLECEDRKDQRLEKQLEASERLAVRQMEANERLALKQMDANERMASGYINAIINLADALRSFSTLRSAEPRVSD